MLNRIGAGSLLLVILLYTIVSLSGQANAGGDEDALPPQCEKDEKTEKVTCNLNKGCKYDEKANVIRCKHVVGGCYGPACNDMRIEESGMERCLTVWNDSSERKIRVTLIGVNFKTTKTISPGGWKTFKNQIQGCFAVKDYFGSRAVYKK